MSSNDSNDMNAGMKKFYDPLVQEVLNKFSKAVSFQDLEECKKFLTNALQGITAQEQAFKIAFNHDNKTDYQKIVLNEIKLNIKQQQGDVEKKTGLSVGFVKKVPSVASNAVKLQIINIMFENIKVK